MKKLTLSLLASVSFLAPANALPVWAELVATSHCEYLAMGAGWDEAMAQALRDKSHWMDEIAAAGNLGARAIAHAINFKCPTMNERAFKLRGQQRNSI